MTDASWVLFAVAAVAAAFDWWSVATDRRRVEYAAKPAVLVALIGAALVLDPAHQAVRWWFVVGLVFGLAGDVLLMLDKFIPGAAAFLLGHIAYVVGFLLVPLQPLWLGAGLLLLVVGVIVVGRRILVAASQRSRVLGGVVVAYLAALAAVLVLGIGTALPIAAAGALLFATSDALLAWGRFVGPAPGGRTLVHITYHCAQALLVLALLHL